MFFSRENKREKENKREEKPILVKVQASPLYRTLRLI